MSTFRTSPMHRACVLVAGTLLLSPVLAENGLSGEISIEFQSDTVTSADSDESEFTNSYATIEPAITATIGPRFSVGAGLVVEQVEYQEEGSLLQDHALGVSEFFLEYSGDGWSAHAGKISPAFGLAWDVAPGIYGADFAGDYEVAGQLGAGASIAFGEQESVALSVDLFMEDTTGLSSCVGHDSCEAIRRSDGGPANTSGPQSLSFTLGADDLGGGLGLQAGVIRRAGGEGDPADEFGFAFALTHATELDESSAMEWMFEWAHMNNFGAGTDDVTYMTAGATYLRGVWNVAFAGSMRSTQPGGMEPETDDALFQLSAGFALDSGLSADLAWRYGDEDGESSQTIGLLIAYVVEF